MNFQFLECKCRTGDWCSCPGPRDWSENFVEQLAFKNNNNKKQIQAIATLNIKPQAHQLNAQKQTPEKAKLWGLWNSPETHSNSLFQLAKRITFIIVQREVEIPRGIEGDRGFNSPSLLGQTRSGRQGRSHEIWTASRGKTLRRRWGQEQLARRRYHWE